MTNLKTELKGIQPYFIEKELLPKLYFKEDNNNTEYWIFFYTYIRGLSGLAIGIRLGYSKQHIYKKLDKIINRNRTLITQFIAFYKTSDF